MAYDDAKSAYDRIKRLYDGGSVTKQQLEDADARAQAAEIQREAAAKALALVQDKAGSQANDIASSQVDQATAQTDLAKSQLDETVLRSPIAGRVSYRDVEAGEMIGTSTLAFVVIDESSVVAEAGLSERAIGAVRKGMGLEVVIPALGDGDRGRRAGIVDSVSPAADPRSMLYQVRILIPNADGALQGGMLARVKIPVETRRGALLVPERSTFSENGADYVLVVALDSSGGQEGSVSRRRITLGESDGSSVEVLDGSLAGRARGHGRPGIPGRRRQSEDLALSSRETCLSHLPQPSRHWALGAEQDADQEDIDSAKGDKTAVLLDFVPWLPFSSIICGFF